MTEMYLVETVCLGFVTLRHIALKAMYLSRLVLCLSGEFQGLAERVYRRLEWWVSCDSVESRRN